MPADAEPTDPEQPASFEAALGELAELVSRLESGSLGLSDSILAYERGVALLKRLHAELAAAETRVATLVRIDDNGLPVLATGELPPAGEAASPARGAGRKQRSRRLPGMDDEAGEG